MLVRNAIVLPLLMICSSCAVDQAHNEADTLPDSKVAIVDVYSGKGVFFNVSAFYLHYFDGTEQMGYGRSFITSGRIMPGKHTLGILVNWGDFCPPLIPLSGTVCFNYCYSGVVLKAEAGRKYSYDIEKNKDEVNMVLLDETGAVAAKGLCEKIPGVAGADSSNTPVIKSVNERLERESKEFEIQHKAE